MTYKEWDKQRREIWPDAYHYHWESYYAGRRIAAWDPSIGTGWVRGLPPGPPLT